MKKINYIQKTKKHYLSQACISAKAPVSREKADDRTDEGVADDDITFEQPAELKIYLEVPPRDGEVQGNDPQDQPAWWVFASVVVVRHKW